MAAATVDVADIIDRHAISRFQYRTLLLRMAVLLMDGHDTQVALQRCSRLRTRLELD